jgi:hypothetical protein
MRRPDDKRAMEVASEAWETPNWRWAVRELMLVLMMDGMCYS